LNKTKVDQKPRTKSKRKFNRKLIKNKIKEITVIEETIITTIIELAEMIEMIEMIETIIIETLIIGATKKRVKVKSSSRKINLDKQVDMAVVVLKRDTTTQKELEEETATTNSKMIEKKKR